MGRPKGGGMESPTTFSQDFLVCEPASERAVMLEYVVHVLKECGGNKSNAAKILGLDRRSLYRRLALAEKAGISCY